MKNKLKMDRFRAAFKGPRMPVMDSACSEGSRDPPRARDTLPHGAPRLDPPRDQGQGCTSLGRMFLGEGDLSRKDFSAGCFKIFSAHATVLMPVVRSILNIIFFAFKNKLTNLRELRDEALIQTNSATLHFLQHRSI